ncbi:hypothetical protein NDU88_001907 [Pleurodeles waltl]|uniref:Insulin receptor substrate 1 n=1 Tax=Pleurodeles waltl TaxID=8319 RepID=A0AAV7LB57_PLEWA|nr:hypothetical protein NDU88_001907 [Pleurodeles waltl]
MASPPEPTPPDIGSGFSDVRRVGYLRKPKSMHKRFFVLRGSSAAGPARLEYYESEKKWRHKAAAPKRCIRLDGCLNIHKRADAKHKHLLALYTREECFSLVAESPQEQEGWYRSLMLELRAGSPEPDLRSVSSAGGPAFREVWQVILKPKGLGQSRNLTGVYRLCLGPRTLSLVKLHAEAAALVLQLMNIRRCGHSEGFFFVELGRSAATGPGELWMQVDDAVVAQSMHETILEAMRALSDEFRPRSKSQSAKLCSNPISVPVRRPQPPPSQAGLSRQAKPGPFRVRASSDGEGSRPASGDGSPASPGRAHSSASCCPRPQRLHPPLSHSRSIPASACRCSPSAAASPASLSSSSTSGHGSTSDGLCPRRSSASVSGSPSDGGFISSDEYGSSPCEFKGSFRSVTPDSPGHTPPADGLAYICMGRGAPPLRRPPSAQDPGFRKRTHSTGTSPPPPAGQQRPPCPACTEDYTAMAQPCRLPAFLPPHCYPAEQPRDDGYMPMSPGVAPARPGDYMLMSPTSVSAPQQILRPRTDSSGYMMMSPSDSCSPDGCGARLSLESGDGKLPCGDYMNMSPASGSSTSTPPDGYLPAEVATQPACAYYSLPRSFKHLHRPGGEDSSSSASSDSLGGQDQTNKSDSPAQTATRLSRPTRLSLDKASTLPRVREPPEPKSPGEYVNIDFSSSNSLCTPPYIEGRIIPQRENLSEYMNMDLGARLGRDYMCMQPGTVTSDSARLPTTSGAQTDNSGDLSAESRNDNGNGVHRQPTSGEQSINCGAISQTRTVSSSCAKMLPTSRVQSISNFGANSSESRAEIDSYVEMPPTSRAHITSNCGGISVELALKNYVQRSPASRVEVIGNYGGSSDSVSESYGDYVEMPATSKKQSVINCGGGSCESRAHNGSKFVEVSATHRAQINGRSGQIFEQLTSNKNGGENSHESRTENSNYVEMPSASRVESIRKHVGVCAEPRINSNHVDTPPASRVQCTGSRADTTFESRTENECNHGNERSIRKYNGISSDPRMQGNKTTREVPPSSRIHFSSYAQMSPESRQQANGNYAEISSAPKSPSTGSYEIASDARAKKASYGTYIGRPPVSRVQKVTPLVSVLPNDDYAAILGSARSTYAEPARVHATCCTEALPGHSNRGFAEVPRIPNYDGPPAGRAHSTYAEMAFERCSENVVFPKAAALQDLSGPASPAPLPGQGSGLSAFTRVSLSPSNARVVRVDPQGRRRHSSETFSSTPSSARAPAPQPCAEEGKRHSSASFENVSLRAEPGKEPPCVSDTPLNYIDLDLGMDHSPLHHKPSGEPCTACSSEDLRPYARITFQKSGDLRSTSAKEE